MKKILSIILSALMAFSACTITALSASAAVVSPGGETSVLDIDTTVNGVVSTEVTFSKDPSNPYLITFTYTGNGVLEGWSFVPENVKVIKEEGKSVTVEVDPSVEKVIANAIVKGVTPETTVPSENETTSPSTGAVALSSLAITGAGIAALSVLKKKNDAE